MNKLRDGVDMFVVSEPELIRDVGTRNNALNEILTFYLQFNNTVTYFSASMGAQDFSARGVRYVSLSSYTKKSRVILSQYYSIRRRFRSLLAEFCDVHVQFRLPSIYVMQIYMIVRDLIPPQNVSFYIAGDWSESLRYNYPNRPHLSRWLPKLQDKMISGSVCVFTGDTLKNKNIGGVSRGFSFYSTTHCKQDVPHAITNKSDKRGICFVGRIEKLKNYKFFIELAKSTCFVNEYVFHILGDGPDADLVRTAAASGDVENLVVHGHIDDRARFNQVVSQCKYFVLCSYTEGTSKALPEMMCRSTVPIAFRGVGSNTDILSFENGFLAELDDVSSVVGFINKMDGDEQEYIQVLKAGLSYAENNSIDSQLSRMFEFLYSSEGGLQ